MNLIWVNGLGILFILILLLISMYPSKSRARPTLSRFHRIRANSSSQIQSDIAQKYVWNVLKRKSIKFHFLPFLLGFFLTFFCSHYNYMNNRLLDLENEFNEEIFTTNLNTNLTSISEINSRNDNRLIREPRIWFVMSTTYSLTQAPSIIRIAQALFPVRHFVTLVLVKHYSIQNGIEHLSDLDRLLRRFSVPYVLLSTRQYQAYLKKTSKLKLGNPKGPALGLLTGIAWVLQDTQRDGVLMMAHEEYTFSSAIFDQIRYTKKFSSWPVAFGPHRSMSLGLTSPIVSKDGKLEGYFDGNSAAWDTMPLEVGAFGINISYFRNNGSLDKAWMLATDFSYTLRDLGFDLEDVQPLGYNCSNILVWRTKCQPHKWPSSIQYKEYYKETNMDTLMRSVFGVRFKDYVREETHLTDLENI